MPTRTRMKLGEVTMIYMYAIFVQFVCIYHGLVAASIHVLLSPSVHHLCWVDLVLPNVSFGRRFSLRAPPAPHAVPEFSVLSSLVLVTEPHCENSFFNICIHTYISLVIIWYFEKVVAVYNGNEYNHNYIIILLLSLILFSAGNDKVCEAGLAAR